MPGIARAACVGPAASTGQVIYNSDYSYFQYCDGTSWFAMNTPVSGAGSTCTNPAGAEGTIIYNKDYRVL